VTLSRIATLFVASLLVGAAYAAASPDPAGRHTSQPSQSAPCEDGTLFRNDSRDGDTESAAPGLESTGRDLPVASATWAGTAPDLVKRSFSLLATRGLRAPPRQGPLR
jgi:hypothetical protein